MIPGKSRSKACRIKAAECDGLLYYGDGPDIKASYQELAMQWRELGAQADELDERLVH